MTERFTPEQERAALELDAAIDAASPQRRAALDAPTARTIELLRSAHAMEPPGGLARRTRAKLERRRERRWLPARLAAAVLGALFVGQGVGNFLFGEKVAEGLDVAFDSHAFFESGVLLVVLGLVVLGGARARGRLDLSALAGVPVGLAFAINGLGELSEFPAGGLLHLTQGLTAIALALLWWHGRCYVLPRRAKNRV